MGATILAALSPPLLVRACETTRVAGSQLDKVAANFFSQRQKSIKSILYCFDYMTSISSAYLAARTRGLICIEGGRTDSFAWTRELPYLQMYANQPFVIHEADSQKQLG